MKELKTSKSFDFSQFLIFAFLTDINSKRKRPGFYVLKKQVFYFFDYLRIELEAEKLLSKLTVSHCILSIRENSNLLDTLRKIP